MKTNCMEEIPQFEVIYFDNVVRIDRSRYFESFDKAAQFIQFRIWYPELYTNFRIKAL